ncbi:hypothetical protein OH807_37000 [Kitasatospora sp. NBC_01560]|uniref:hypothetical protein n=1 Tax=Kitasatospora sp. NBC_01560 TaxID=2975965 RepID=UPI003866668C
MTSPSAFPPFCSGPSTSDARRLASIPCPETCASKEAAAAEADAAAADTDASADSAVEASADGGSPENEDGSGAVVSVAGAEDELTDGLVEELLHATASTPTPLTTATNATARTPAPHRRGNP